MPATPESKVCPICLRNALVKSEYHYAERYCAECGYSTCPDHFGTAESIEKFYMSLPKLEND